jgi:hypothetical protein
VFFKIIFARATSSNQSDSRSSFLFFLASLSTKALELRNEIPRGHATKIIEMSACDVESNHYFKVKPLTCGGGPGGCGFRFWFVIFVCDFGVRFWFVIFVYDFVCWERERECRDSGRERERELGRRRREESFFH